MQAIKNIDALATEAVAFFEKHGISLEHAAAIKMVEQLQRTAPAVAPESVPSDPHWSVHAGAMTDAQYLARGGNCCPSCGSGDISGNSFTVDGRTAFQGVTCADCDASWNDTYALSGFDDLEDGINNEAITAVVEDVQERAKKYEFSVDSEEQALECIADSECEVGEELSEAEKKLAVERLLNKAE
jgi:hypothetical protein